MSDIKYKSEVHHKSGEISAKIVAHSISPQGKEFITFELEYPRIIHSEKLTHSLLSPNSASSRAIPVSSVNKRILDKPAMPVRFGQKNKGMQDLGSDYHELVKVIDDCGEHKLAPQDAWKYASEMAVIVSQAFDQAGYAKQVCNRLTEPFQRMKTVVSGTEFANFFWLRDDKDADPTIAALAQAMLEALSLSTPDLLQPGEWHVPYVGTRRTVEGDSNSELIYFVFDKEGNEVVLSKEEAKEISSSCCAQVSYRSLDNTKDKALSIYDRLLSGNKVHASPFEHQGTPMLPTFTPVGTDVDGITKIYFHNKPNDSKSWEEGITHVNRQGEFWSGRKKGWIEHRQLLNNHTKW